MATTTAVILEDSLELGFPEQASRVVRFDNECVLIPKSPTTTRSKLPVVLTKSYSLPLWKKRSPDSDVEDTAVVGSSAGPQSLEENRVTIKVPIPTFKRRSSSQSPAPRARSISVSPTIPNSLPSCLVYRSPSELASRPSPTRRPSLPIYHRRQDELTIPLRDCCADCERITEECLKEGNDWEEKFSRGARRRRSASLEYRDSTLPPSHRINSNPTKAAAAGASTDPTSRFPTAATAFSITVDEVDKRRKTFDYSMEDTDFIRSLSPPSPSSSHPFHSSTSPFACSGNSPYLRVKPRDREASSSSTSSMSTTDELLLGPDIHDSYTRLRSSPIEEEDETQLFPLPLRSRSNTPSPSPSNGSSSSLSVRNAPRPSPSSKRNSCSLQGKKVSNNSPSRKVKNEQQPSDTPNEPGSSAIQVSSTTSANSDIPDQNSPPLSAPPSPSFIPRRPSQQKGRLSFTLPFIKAGGAIRDAGVDVLRGVTSMSSGGLSA